MNVGLLIDINSILSEYISYIYNETVKHGNVITKKAYGYISDISEKNKMYSLGFTIVNSEEKYQDRIPCQLLVDALEMGNMDTIEEIHLATNDEYIVEAVAKLREKGKKVVLYGNEQVGQHFLQCSDCFRYLEILSGKKCNGLITDLDIIIKDIQNIIIEGKASGRNVKGSELLDNLSQQHGEFDIRNYGYTTLKTFLEKNIPGIVVDTQMGEVVIEPVDDREKIEEWIVTFLVARDNKIEDMDEMFKAIKIDYPHFDTRNYGYKSEIAFILSFPKLEIYENKGIKLKQSFKLK